MKGRCGLVPTLSLHLFFSIYVYIYPSLFLYLSMHLSNYLSIYICRTLFLLCTTIYQSIYAFFFFPFNCLVNLFHSLKLVSSLFLIFFSLSVILTALSSLSMLHISIRYLFYLSFSLCLFYVSHFHFYLPIFFYLCF